MSTAPEKSSKMAPVPMPQNAISLLVPNYSGSNHRHNEMSGVANVDSGLPLRWEIDLPQRPWQALLGTILGVDQVSNGAALPAAALLTGIADPLRYVICASPVHLGADRDTATMLAQQALEVTDQESTALLHDLNEFVKEDKLLFFKLGAEWFLEGPNPFDIRGYPPSFVANRNASAYLPEGENSAQWRRLMSELQMLLHSHPVNMAREQVGKPSINCLWLWGGEPWLTGTEITNRTNSGCHTVFADEPYAQALARYAKMDCQPLASFNPRIAKHCVVVDTRVFDIPFPDSDVDTTADPLNTRQSLENNWLVPLCERVRENELDCLRLYNEDGDGATVDIESISAQVEEPNSIVQRIGALALFKHLHKLWLRGRTV